MDTPITNAFAGQEMEWLPGDTEVTAHCRVLGQWAKFSEGMEVVMNNLVSALYAEADTHKFQFRPSTHAAIDAWKSLGG